MICWFCFFKIILKNSFSNTIRVEHFGSRSVPTLCQAWSGSKGTQWLSGRVLDLRPRVRASSASLGCGPWARPIYPSLVLVQPWKTRPCLTERLLMGRKESNKHIIDVKLCEKLGMRTGCNVLINLVIYFFRPHMKIVVAKVTEI